MKDKIRDLRVPLRGADRHLPQARGLPLERCTVGVAALNQYAGTGAETLGQVNS